MKAIDLRSDTVTKPTAAMRAAMTAAEVGDDVYGEDPTVNRLQTVAARMLGTEDALFVSSGTQGNLVGVLSHCERGDEYIVGQHAHTYKYEGGGAAVLGSVQPQPLDFEADGTLDLGKVEAAIKPDDSHFARTRLLALENTQGGKVLPVDYIRDARALCDRNGLALHLDGARVFNAAVALGVPVDAISKYFDSVSFCLSKGLGAPVGSVLCGSRELIDKARRWRKVVGGGMRQVGILAAAGLHALEQHVDRLAEDHANAKALAAGLADIQGTKVESVSTNMVFVSMPVDVAMSLQASLEDKGIIVSIGKPTRLVAHLDVTREDVDTVIVAVRDFFASEPARKAG